MANPKPNPFAPAVALLSQHASLHRHRVVDVLKLGLLSELPAEWRAHFEAHPSVRDFTSLEARSSLPSSLTSFVAACEGCSELAPAPSETLPSPACFSLAERRGLKPKKVHELERLVPLVERVVAEEAVAAVLDIGSGLGHLSRALSARLPSSVKVLGVEASSSLCSAASSKPSAPATHQLRLGDDAASRDFLGEALRAARPGKVLLVSLHGCGDLQPTLMRLIAGMEEASSAVLLFLPCCYHRMESPASFPLSEALKAALAKTAEGPALLTGASLRLAAQQTLATWRATTEEEHREHEEHVLLRCLREAYPAVRELDALRPGIEGLREALAKIADGVQGMPEALETSHLLEPFTGLQFCLQGVLESVILRDRRAFLEEAFPGAVTRLTPLFDPTLSPRNVCLFASLAPG